MADNLVTFPNRTRIREEAAQWLAKLDGGPLSVEDDRNLRGWLTADPRHRACLLELAAIFDDTNVLADLAELFPLQKTEGHKTAAPGRWALFRPVWLAATAASVLLVYLYGVPGYMHPIRPADNAVPAMAAAYRTAVGEQRSYQLADGSTVMLNTDSWIEVDFTAAERGVRLLSGEVHFSIARDEHVPFVVYTRLGRIRVTGTAFNVRLSDAGVDVTVTEGKVALHRRPAEWSAVEQPSTADGGDEVLILHAGQRILFDLDNEQLEAVSPMDLDKVLSWQRGILIFEGETLATAVREINRYTRKEIVIEDEKVGDMRVGGYFKSDDVDATLRILEDNFNLSVTRLAPDRILLSSREAER